METAELPLRVPQVAGLDIMDLDPHEAADDYRARVIGPYRGVLPDSEVAALEEKLAGACTVEVAAFDAFARLLADPTASGQYDQVLFDTAPTGHTIRLLSLPAAWSDYLGASPDATSCLGPLAGLQDDRPLYATAVDALGDATRTTLVLVTRPDPGALKVAASASAELRDLGIGNQQLVVNGVLAEPLEGDPIAVAVAQRQQRALASLPPELTGLRRSLLPLLAYDLVGIPALRQLAGDATATVVDRVPAQTLPSWLGGTRSLIDEIEQPGHGVVLVTGKGGVGKTTIAHLIAFELVRRGHAVHWSTTDPAGTPPEGSLPAGLTASAIDPTTETQAYIRERLAAAARNGLDEAHLDLLAEDLRSPCSQEVAVFHAFRELLARARHGFVVIDTAPTGHTLLLLDITGSFHRQVMDDIGHTFRNVTTPLMRLQDPSYSKVLIVTLAETTPVNEATELQEDLRRAGIEPFGWLVNATLAGSGTRDPVLAARAFLEAQQLERIHERAAHVWCLPWSDTPLAE